jgi:hypothetical protein
VAATTQVRLLVRTNVPIGLAFASQLLVQVPPLANAVARHRAVARAVKKLSSWRMNFACT